MRGVVVNLNRYLFVLTLGVALIACSLISLSAHTKSTSAQTINCASSCEQHAQPTVTRPEKEAELKEKEPVPPQLTLVLNEVSYFSLLSVVLISFSYLYWRRKLILSSHLKF